MNFDIAFIVIIITLVCQSDVSESRRANIERGPQIRSRRSENQVNAGGTDRVINPTCTPGTRWKNDCNNCYCTETGLGICTLMACLPSNDNFNNLKPIEHRRFRRSHSGSSIFNAISENGSEKTIESERVTEHTIQTPACEPGTRWKNDCNNCFCTANGHAVCTLMGCFSINSVTPRNVEPNNVNKSVNPPKTCVPGSRWMQDCNTCFCTQNGMRACTRMACFTVNEQNRVTRSPIVSTFHT